jgi:hypothetical protein
MPAARQIAANRASAARAASRPFSIPANAIPVPSLTCHAADCLATPCLRGTIPKPPQPQGTSTSLASFRDFSPTPAPAATARCLAKPSRRGLCVSAPGVRFARAVANLPAATPTIQNHFHILGFVPLFFGNPRPNPFAGPNTSPNLLRAASAIPHLRVDGDRTWNQTRPRRNHRCRAKFAGPRILPYQGFQ